MNVKKPLFLLFLLGSILMSACSEGENMASSRIDEQKENSRETVGGQKLLTEHQLEAKLTGGIYEIDSWDLKESAEDAGIKFEDMAGTVNEEDYRSMKHILLVNMRFTNSPDMDGEISQTMLTNNFLPITGEGLESMKNADPDSETDQASADPYGDEAIYLDRGKPGQSNYFEISSPKEGESITYTLAYHLSEEEYKAAAEGDLYLLLAAGGMEKAEALHLLPEEKQ